MLRGMSLMRTTREEKLPTPKPGALGFERREPWSLRCPKGVAVVSRFFIEQPDPLAQVIGQNKTYDCPTLVAVDAHLSELHHRIRSAPAKFPNLLAQYRADFDLLLDRRLWLEMTATPEVSA